MEALALALPMFASCADYDAYLNGSGNMNVDVLKLELCVLFLFYFY